MIYSLITITIISENNINNNVIIIILFYCNFLNIINNQLNRFILWNEIWPTLFFIVIRLLASL